MLESVLVFCFGQEYANLFRNGTIGCVNAIFKAAVCFNEFSAVCDYSDHAALISGTAIAAEEGLFFHLQFLRDAKPHRLQSKTCGSRMGEFVSK